MAQATADTDAAVPSTGHEREQLPHIWWQNVRHCLDQVAAALRERGYGLEQLRGMAVDGTSGTLIAVNAAGQPIRPALMYNDARSATEAADLNERAQLWCAKAGYRIEPSFAIAKIVWIQRHEKEVFARTSRFIHQADYIVGRLTGNFAVTDYSNALENWLRSHSRALA